jgi:hypothetical protein
VGVHLSDDLVYSNWSVPIICVVYCVLDGAKKLSMGWAGSMGSVSFFLFSTKSFCVVPP